jgi:tagatose 1,6-diphosphate aldolase
MTASRPPVHGVAVDAGSGLDAAIRAARGDMAQPGDLRLFKRAVLRTLGPLTTTVLLDAEYGPGLLPDYPVTCEPMLALEADVYRIAGPDRMTVLPDHLTVADFPRLGVRQLKFFMYYAPDDDPALNARKESMIAGIGAKCLAQNVSFLLEPLVYHPVHALGSAAYAAAKPDMVRRTVAVFAQPRFGASILKIEVPVDLSHVAGFGIPQMTRADALDAIRATVTAAGSIPVVFLSAGVPFDWFEASLHLAREAGVRLAGFMCGRSIWSDAVGVFGEQGEAALTDWLGDVGQARLRRLIAAL